MPKKQTKELPSVADLRQCIEALNEPISPFWKQYHEAKTGDKIFLGEYNLSEFAVFGRNIYIQDFGLGGERPIFMYSHDGQKTKLLGAEDPLLKHWFYSERDDRQWYAAGKDGIYVYNRGSLSFVAHDGTIKILFDKGAPNSCCTGPLGLYWHKNDKIFLINSQGQRSVVAQNEALKEKYLYLCCKSKNGFMFLDVPKEQFCFLSEDGRDFKPLRKCDTGFSNWICYNRIYIKRLDGVYAIMEDGSEKFVGNDEEWRGTDYCHIYRAGEHGLYLGVHDYKPNSGYKIYLLVFKG